MNEIKNEQIKVDYVVNLNQDNESKYGEVISIEQLSTLSNENLNNKRVLINNIEQGYNEEKQLDQQINELLSFLASNDVKIYLLTNSALIVDDLHKFSEITNLVIGVTAGSANDKLLEVTENSSVTYRQRMNTLESVAANGISNFLHLAPIYPFIGNYEAIIRNMHHKVDHIYLENFKPKAEEVDSLIANIAQNFPELEGAYQKIFNDEHYFDIFWDAETANIHQIAKELDIEEKIHLNFNR